MTDGSLKLTGVTLVIPQGATLETIIAQLQKYTTQCLITTNGERVHHVRQIDELKPSVRLEHTAEIVPSAPEFYLRDLNTDDQICCFKVEHRDHLLNYKRTGQCIDMTPDVELAPAVVTTHQF